MQSGAKWGVSQQFWSQRSETLWIWTRAFLSKFSWEEWGVQKPVHVQDSAFSLEIVDLTPSITCTQAWKFLDDLIQLAASNMWFELKTSFGLLRRNNCTPFIYCFKKCLIYCICAAYSQPNLPEKVMKTFSRRPTLWSKKTSACSWKTERIYFPANL